MTRHAVEEHLGPAPEVTPDTRLAIYDDGCQVWCAGTTTIYVELQTGLFWKDEGRKIPASDDEARRVGVPVREWAHKRRAMKLRADTEEHIARITQRTSDQSAEQPPEDLKAKTRRLIREYEKRVQAEADKQRTSWLDSEAPTP
jgi:hypothetical protein